MRETAFDAFRTKITARNNGRQNFLFDDEFESITKIQRELREEIDRFYRDELSKIRKRLEEEPIDTEIRHLWIKHLEKHMSHSFEMSEHFLEVLLTQKLEDFSLEFQKRISR